MSDELDTDVKDRLVAAARGALSAVPFAGGLLGELFTEVIPGQRYDRIVAYVRLLEARITLIEAASISSAMGNPEKIDLIERGGVQAARATSQERIAQIVEVVAHGLEAEEAEIIRRKRLMELLGELDDDEIAVLTAYGRSYAGGDPDAFDAIGRPSPMFLSAPREVIEQNALYDLGVERLLRAGLLKRQFRNVKKGEFPEFDSKTGGLKGRVEISFLGRMLLRQMGILIPFQD
ncbi:MAG: hypothetical protein CGW95_01360 [Phenylobacterium zucineum]|nr:MAG: hypothetical protein CGW95_01360 [Phenylobacterium zucineum]